MKRVISTWIKNARVTACVQSVMPAILAVVIAAGTPGFNILLSVLAVFGVAFAHLALNLSDDYFDYLSDMHLDRLNVQRKGIKAYTAKYPYLTDGSASLKDLRCAIFVLVALALACGLVIFVFRGWVVLLIAALAGFLGVFYTAPPLKLAYHGLGELVTGFIFGPLLMVGVYIAACGGAWNTILAVSVPVGLLVANILYTHSFIDNAGDEESGKVTLAGLMDRIAPAHKNEAKLAVSMLLIFLPFAVVVLAVLTGDLRWPYLALLLMLPRAIWLYRSLVKFTKGESIDDEIENPSKVVGNLGNWEQLKASGLGWFLIRWLTARNIVAGYCTIAAVVAIILKFI